MYKDVMTHNTARLASKILPKNKVLELVQKSSRENSRTPMQWSDARNAGFSTAEPWFPLNGNYLEVNVAAQEKDPDSLLNFYRKLIDFRKKHPIAVYGDYREYFPEDKHFYVYERSFMGRRLLVICSFSSELLRFNAPDEMDLTKWELELSNYDYCFAIGNGFTARPYELRVYSLK